MLDADKTTKTFTVRQLTTMAVLVAIGTMSVQFLSLPLGLVKAYPVQHAINVLAAVLFGPLPAVTIAFLVSLLRNLLGVGTIFSFPGSVVGACLAGWLFKQWRSQLLAAGGEIIGTGMIGAIASVPIARLVFGEEKAVLAFVPSFLVSSVCGAVIGVIIVRYLQKTPLATFFQRQA
ncbi:energy coupling factor transporter S component ThiW [Numidum massiliense]|uniref:energy coupling factor transporter S component ThiW n=1 Tax=Numidum massiliense TaxID=1522315 RepID=UPI0006D55944|nr:energy coupling factor transporter S component ThiW [Numidum massiliense]